MALSSFFAPSIQLFGFTFYWYGFFVGLAVIATLLVVEKKAEQVGLPTAEFWSQAWVLLIAAACGGRLWYVLSEGLLWTGRWQQAFQIWQGGMSILGAIAAVIATSWWLHRKTERVWLWWDVFAFGIPVGQIIGRFGNFINQELYGLPSNLPWAIVIDSAHRLPGFENFSRYHPLFAYEQLLLVLFVVFIWRLSKTSRWPVGSGAYIWLYITYYTSVRFLLDFLRLQKTYIIDGWLGLNQALLVVVLVVVAFGAYIHKQRKGTGGV